MWFLRQLRSRKLLILHQHEEMAKESCMASAPHFVFQLEAISHQESSKRVVKMLPKVSYAVVFVCIALDGEKIEK